MTSEESVVAVYDNVGKAKQAVKRLCDSGVASAHISFVAQSLEDQNEVTGYLDQGDRTETDAARGAIVGGVLGLLIGAAFFWIPGFGALVVLGPLAAGMTGSAVGALVGAMTGWGIPKDRVQRYEQIVREGKLLVVVHADPLTVAEAHRHLQATEPEELHLYAENSSDSPEIDDSSLRT